MGNQSLLVSGVLYLNVTKLTEPMRSDWFARDPSQPRTRVSFVTQTLF
ncbi:hypothetical protein M2244_003793 [Rhodoferax antarcticus]|nr:hypothetical protein [Rhodoferax antarcticus]